MRARLREMTRRPRSHFPWKRAAVWGAFAVLMIPAMILPGSPMRSFFESVFRKGDRRSADNESIDTRLAPNTTPHIVVASSNTPPNSSGDGLPNPDAAASPEATGLEAAQPTGTGTSPAEQDRDRLGINLADLALLKDSTPLSRPQERGVFLRVLSTLKGHTQAELTKRLTAREGSRDVSFSQLFRQPEVYRGKLVRLKGIARAAFEVRTPVRVLVNDKGEPVNEAGESVVGDGDPTNDRGVMVNAQNVPVKKDDDPSNDDGVPANDLGIKSYYEIWLSMSNNQNLVKVAALELPANFPLSPVEPGKGYKQIEEPVDVVGVFYKLALYNDALEEVRSTPLILTISPYWRPSTASSKAPLPSPIEFWAMLGGTAVAGFAGAGLLYYLAGAKARMAAAAREAQVKPEHVQQLKTLDVVAPEVHTDLERIAAETPEPPQAWEVMESAEEEPDQRR